MAALMIFLSWLFIGAIALLIIVPYLRGRSDLVTAWNMFLMGSIVFVGYAMIVAVGQRHYIEYEDADYLRYWLGVGVFYSVLVVSYYKLKLPRRMAGGTVLKWPPATPGVLYFTLPIAAVFIVGMLFPPPIPVLQQMALLLGIPVLAFSLTLACAAWYQRRANVVLLVTWLVLLVIVVVLTVKTAFGRRPMIGALLSAPIVFYWLRWRYRRPSMTLVKWATAVFLILVIAGAYLQMRQQHVNPVRDLAFAVQATKEFATSLLSPNLTSGNVLAQDTAECSLLAIHLYTHELPPEPFHSIYFVLVNPIPRVFWDDKPVALGRTLAVDGHIHCGLPDPGPVHNWGPGIIGHGYHEGGAVMLAFYGVLFGFVLRFIDEMLMRQPNNPYVLGCFAAVSGHLIGWSRGDIGDFSIHIIAGVLATLAICWAGRIVFGVGLVYPRTSHLDVTKRGFRPAKLAGNLGSRLRLRGPVHRPET